METLFAQQQVVVFPNTPAAMVGNLAGLVTLVCYILVLIKMFQNNQSTLGILCIVGLLVCGLGYLVAFVYGWMNSDNWKIRNVMIVWTVALVLSIALGGYAYSTGPVVVSP